MMRRGGWQLGLGVFLMLGAGSVAWGQADAITAAPRQSALYWVFLTSGKSTQGVEPSEIERMQAAHLANFGRLHREGKLFTAGPLADPEKKRRGIVVVQAPNLVALAELFHADPYIQQGYMTVDAIRMDVVIGEFQAAIDPSQLAEYRLVLLDDAQPGGAEIDAATEQQNRLYCQSIHDAERLCFAGWLQNDRHARRGILIFRRLDDAVLRSLVDEFPAVKSQAWKATVIPLYMSEGVVR